AFRRPKEVPAIGKEVEVVMNIDPAHWISFSQNPFCCASVAIGKVQAELMLISRERLHADPATVRQPLHPQDRIEGPINDLHPRRSAPRFHYANANLGIGLSGFRISLPDHARSVRLEIDKGTNLHS